MCNVFLPRRCILGTRGLLQASPRHSATHVAAAGRTLHRPAVAALVCCATAQTLDSSRQQPRTRRRTKGSTSSTSGPAEAESTLTPVFRASAHINICSAPSGAPSSSSSNSNSTHSSAESTHSSSTQDAAPDPYSFQSCMHLVALHSAFLVDWRSHHSSSNFEQRHIHLATSVLQQHVKPGDRWLFVRCGSLLDCLPGPNSAVCWQYCSCGRLGLPGATTSCGG
jgi:hypothetical protein